MKMLLSEHVLSMYPKTLLLVLSLFFFLNVRRPTDYYIDNGNAMRKKQTSRRVSPTGVYYRLYTNQHKYTHTKRCTRVSVKHAPRSTNEHYLSLSFTLMFYLTPLPFPFPLRSPLFYDIRRATTSVSSGIFDKRQDQSARDSP